MSLDEDELIALDDAALARHANEVIIGISDEVTNALGGVLDEIFERFAPDAQWEAWRQLYTQLDDDFTRVDANLEGLREAMQRRESKRLVRRALSGS